MVPTQPDIIRTWELATWAICQSVPLPYLFMPYWDKKDLPHNTVLHSEKRHDLLISPSIVACCFLLPAVTAQPVGSYKQVGKVMPCRRWLDRSEQVQRPPCSHSSGAATVTCSCHLQAQPSAQKPPKCNLILEIPGMSGEHTFFYTPWGCNTEWWDAHLVPRNTLLPIRGLQGSSA